LAIKVLGLVRRRRLGIGVVFLRPSTLVEASRLASLHHPSTRGNFPWGDYLPVSIPNSLSSRCPPSLRVSSSLFGSYIQLVDIRQSGFPPCCLLLLGVTNRQVCVTLTRVSMGTSIRSRAWKGIRSPRPRPTHRRVAIYQVALESELPRDFFPTNDRTM